jgi:hypothetical protein
MYVRNYKYSNVENSEEINYNFKIIWMYTNGKYGTEQITEAV